MSNQKLKEKKIKIKKIKSRYCFGASTVSGNKFFFHGKSVCSFFPFLSFFMCLPDKGKRRREKRKKWKWKQRKAWNCDREREGFEEGEVRNRREEGREETVLPRLAGSAHASSLSVHSLRALPSHFCSQPNFNRWRHVILDNIFKTKTYKISKMFELYLEHQDEKIEKKKI